MRLLNGGRRSGPASDERLLRRITPTKESVFDQAEPAGSPQPLEVPARSAAARVRAQAPTS
jgi:hypothetical protein